MPKTVKSCVFRRVIGLDDARRDLRRSQTAFYDIAVGLYRPVAGRKYEITMQTSEFLFLQGISDKR